MKDDNTIYLTDEKGNKKKYDLLISFNKDEKEYIIYTDNTKDEDGFIKTYAGIYAKKKDKEYLEPVEDDEDFEIIQKLLVKLEREDTLK